MDRSKLIEIGLLRRCADCDFVADNRQDWRAHERKFGHEQNMKGRAEPGSIKDLDAQ